MIGVVAAEADRVVIGEFFQLFKTPWEFFSADKYYDVVLCTTGDIPSVSSPLIILFGAQRQKFDEVHSLITKQIERGARLCFGSTLIPLYRSCLAFVNRADPSLLEEQTGHPVRVEISVGGQRTIRLGFDLFAESRYLLEEGQPSQFAAVPALDLHIALLRDVIVGCSMPFVEIPPVPLGHDFIVCLTHDVDHVSLRLHKWGHTMFGFVLRAVFGSLVSVCRGRKPLEHLTKNWKAVLSLPFVYAGWAKDFWEQLDRYLQLENELPSTFFILPRSGEPGIDPQGNVRRKRASAYGAADISEDLRKLSAAGREIALHGINAWRDAREARSEREEIETVTRRSAHGVRMHWLYFDADSPAKLEEGGFAYDSSCGFNDAVGYKAGTAQVYMPSGCRRLLELPLHVMDTAMFYPDYLDFTEQEAQAAIQPLLENALTTGGVLTINWHDRSLGPERLWEHAYVTLLDLLRRRNPWFATADDAVSWFRKRRETSFVSVKQDGERVQVELSRSSEGQHLPALRLRVYNSSVIQAGAKAPNNARFKDFVIGASDQVLAAA